MITSYSCIVNHCILKSIFKIVRNQKIIDSPSDITSSRSCPVAPPSIGISFRRIEISKAIDKSGLEKISYSLSFFVGKSCTHRVLFWTSQIYLLMCDIEISTYHDWFCLFKPSEILEKCFIPHMVAILKP